MNVTENNQIKLFDKQKYEAKLSDKLISFISKLQRISEMKKGEIVSTLKELDDINAFVKNYEEVHKALQLSSETTEFERLKILNSLIDFDDDCKLDTDKLLFISNFKLEATACLFRVIKLINALIEQTKLINALIEQTLSEDVSEDVSKFTYIYNQIKQMSLDKLFPIDTFIEIEENVSETNKISNQYDLYAKCKKDNNQWESIKIKDESNKAKKEEVVENKKSEIKFKEKNIFISEIADFSYKFQMSHESGSEGSDFEAEKVPYTEDYKKEMSEKLILFLNNLQNLDNLQSENDKLEKIKEIVNNTSNYDYDYFEKLFENNQYLIHNFKNMADYFIFSNEMKEVSFFGIDHQWLWRYLEGKQDLFRNVSKKDFIYDVIRDGNYYEKMIQLTVNHMNKASISSYSKNAYRVLYKYFQIKDSESESKKTTACTLEFENIKNIYCIEKTKATLNIKDNVYGTLALVKQAPTNVVKEFSSSNIKEDYDFSLNTKNYKCNTTKHKNFFETILDPPSSKGDEPNHGFTIDVFENTIPLKDIKTKDVRKLFFDYEKQFLGKDTKNFSLTKVAPADKEVVMFGNMCDEIIKYDGTYYLSYEGCKNNIQYEVKLDFLECLCLFYHIHKIKGTKVNEDKCVETFKRLERVIKAEINKKINKKINTVIKDKEDFIIDKCIEIKKAKKDEANKIEIKIDFDLDFKDNTFEFNICPLNIENIADISINIKSTRKFTENIAPKINDLFDTNRISLNEEGSFGDDAKNYIKNYIKKDINNDITNKIYQEIVNCAAERFIELCEKTYDEYYTPESEIKRKIDFIMSFIDANPNLNRLNDRGTYIYGDNNPIKLLKEIFL